MRLFIEFQDTPSCANSETLFYPCTVLLSSQAFPSQRVDVTYDYELLPSRKPKFLAQTAAHVSGAAFYYQQSDVKDQPWGDKVTPFILFVQKTFPFITNLCAMCFPAENVWSVCAS